MCVRIADYEEGRNEPGRVMTPLRRQGVGYGAQREWGARFIAVYSSRSAMSDDAVPSIGVKRAAPRQRDCNEVAAVHLGAADAYGGIAHPGTNVHKRVATIRTATAMTPH